jgi:hypothetical protein
VKLFGARGSPFSAVALAAALLGGVLFACSTFSGVDLSAPDGGGMDAAGDDTSTLDATAPEAGASDAPAEALADAGHDAHFSLSCGMTSCTTPGDGCCVDRSRTPPDGFGCARENDICPVSSDLRYTCDDADDCTLLGKPGTVCCGAIAPDVSVYYLLSTECTLAANCAAANEVRLCDRAVDGECPAGKPCEPLTMFNDMVNGPGPVSPQFPACRP